MPIHINKDRISYYVQWGKSGNRFNPDSERSYDIAYKKVLRQMAAIFAHGYKR